MNRSLVLLAPLIALLTPNLLYADRVGGGADILHCPKRAVPLELLDIREAIDRYPGGKFQDPSRPVRELLGELRNRLAVKDRVAAEKDFERSIQILEDLEDHKAGRTPRNKLARFTAEKLPDIEDSSEEVIFEDCEKFQFVIQNPPDMVGDRKFVWSEKYYDLSNNATISAAINHEVKYEHARDAGENNSNYIRKLNGLQIVGEIHDTTDIGYLQALQRSKTLKSSPFHYQ